MHGGDGQGRRKIKPIEILFELRDAGAELLEFQARGKAYRNSPAKIHSRLLSQYYSACISSHT
jgi:hypothetical protein